MVARDHADTGVPVSKQCILGSDAMRTEAPSTDPSRPRAVDAEMSGLSMLRMAVIRLRSLSMRAPPLRPAWALAGVRPYPYRSHARTGDDGNSGFRVSVDVHPRCPR